jgi:hypothetical protein
MTSRLLEHLLKWGLVDSITLGHADVSTQHGALACRWQLRQEVFMKMVMETLVEWGPPIAYA